jgi:transcriptional regulator with GAF, ATPase, and Fis domain
MQVWLHCHGTDGPLPREPIVRALAAEGVQCHTGEAGGRPPFGLILFDQESPELLDFVRHSSRDGASRVVAVGLTRARLPATTRWKLIQAGASDAFAWDDFGRPAAALAARLKRWAEVDELLASPLVRDNLAGGSAVWRSTLRQVIEVARFTDASVLLVGESGTGKELVARLIHSLDARPQKGQLVLLDCTTVVSALSGSEFFGHERGAFTSAVAARDGAFALADGGTLFLDEVGELPLTLQAELLRVVQEHTYKRVGSNTWRQVNFRLVCATNRDLLAEEARGRFRRDLYFRIASWTCRLPALRERREDVLPLARHFLKEVFGAGGVPDFDPAVRDYLLVREYPGNVRELRQLVHRLAKRHVGDGPITLGDLPEDERLPASQAMREDWRNGDLLRAVRRALAQGVGLKELTAQTAKTAIQIALEDEEGNVRRAAAKLQVTDRALQMRRAADQWREPAESGEFRPPAPPPPATDRPPAAPPPPA